MKKLKLSLSTTHIILLSFFIAVLLGAALLSLPISSATGEWTPFVDALFTSTTATCVTGLVVVPTFSAWSTFGHIVILFLIQILKFKIQYLKNITSFYHKRQAKEIV